MSRLTLERSRHFSVPAGTMWRVVADLDGYAGHVPTLAVTEVIDGSGIGAMRRCENTNGQDWTESVVEWTEGRRYSIRVDTSTYPQPLRSIFRSFRGTWSVQPTPTGCDVTIRFDADVRGGPIGGAIVRRMAASAEEDIERILDSYGEAAVSGSAGPTDST